MTRTDLSQNALPAIRPAQDTLGGAGSGTDSPAPPPAPSSPSPVPTTHARGAPSTDAPKTGQAILRDMQDKLSAYFGNEIHLDDEELDFIVATLGNRNDDAGNLSNFANLPNLTKNTDFAPPDTLTGGCPNFCPSSPIPQPAQIHKGFHFGGYDGMTELGIEGYWLSDCLEKTCEVLEQVRAAAGETSDALVEGGLGGHDILVSASGAKSGLYYRYRIVVGGVTILLHHNPPKGRQPARVRFSAESLMVNLAPAVWQRVREFFKAVGFVVTEAVPSRVDLQVTTDCLTIPELVELDKNNQVVRKLRKQKAHGDNVFAGEVETVEYGVGSSPVQITFYDKWNELHSGGNCLTQKYMLNLQKMGDDWVNSGRPVTRVEIRISRDGLKAMGINSVDDLFGNEWAVINLITHKWFRILDEPKKKGNEWKQNNHPLWDEIRSLFRVYFPEGHDDTKAEWNPPKPVACDPEALEKQALGCLSKALALRNGRDEDMGDTVLLTQVWLDEAAHWLHYKRNLIAMYMEIKSGVPLRNWTKGWTKEDHQADKEERYHMRCPLWSPEHTIDKDTLELKRKQLKDWLTSIRKLLPDNVTAVPFGESPVRGSGESVELTGTTGRERFKESMDIINCNERFVPHDLDEYKLE